MTDTPRRRLTSDQIAALIGDLSPQQRELFDLMLKEEGLENSSNLITPRPRQLSPDGQHYQMPLSFAQQRLWFLDQWEPNSPLYNIPSAVRIIGRLNIDLLRDVLTEIVERHEILRTTFPSSDGQPFQKIARTQTFDLQVVELSALAPQERQARSAQLIEEEAQRPFDLLKGPLMRTTIFKIGEDEYIALFNLHHIISDGWSTGVLVREVATLYEAMQRGQEAPLSRLPIQYADYAIWQQEWLRGPIFDQQLEYWKEHLGGSPPVLNLPTDRPKPPYITYKGATHSFQINKEIANRLAALGNEENTTLFMSLLAAFQVLLYRYSGQTDLCVGTPIANRTRADFENLIGFFVNTLVLRSDLSGNPSFRDLLRRVKEITLGAYANQDLPFEILVEKLHPARDASYNPLFQVMFILQNAPADAIRLTGLSIEGLSAHSGTAKFELTLIMGETPSGYHAELEYNTDLFDPVTIERMAIHFSTLLAHIAADPDCAIGSLDILSEWERSQLLVDFNDNSVIYETPDPDFELCLHRGFEAQVEKTPDVTAVVYEGQQVTYAELNGRANRLANYLRALGVGPEKIVGLHILRSIEMVVGMLAILKAGGAYLPIDPVYPPERIMFMLDDANVEVLLSQSKLMTSLPDIGREAIQLDQDWEPDLRNSISAADRTRLEMIDLEANLPSIVTNDKLAYTIYTSGSTGRPKGVMIEHRGAYNIVRGWISLFSFGVGVRFLEFSSISFDVSVGEIFSILLSGATMYLTPRDTLVSVQELGDFIRREKITAVFLPPAVMARLPCDDMPVLETVITGGESSIPEIAARWTAGRIFGNIYGPTETTVAPTYYIIDGRGSSEMALREQYQHLPTIPIGKPIPNIQCYILDSLMNPVPIGVTGELYIGGVGVSRGYLHRPELTQERFIPNIFSSVPGERLYRTGDLGRYLPDGNIEYQGRVDFQVKIRGFRIELGEIESVLTEHFQIQQAVVIVSGAGTEDKKLVAYLVPEQDATIAINEVRSYLRSKLPEYMVPAIFVILERFPLNTSGKVDRKALPAPEMTSVDRTGVFIAPRNPEEEVLAAIWSEVLGVSPIGVTDIFFDLGGHSLLVTQVLSRVRKSFNVELAVRSIFEKPTIAGMAELIRTVKSSLSGGTISTIVPVERNGNNPLSFAQQRLWFLEQFSPGTANYNIPAVIRLDGRVDVPALEASLQEIVRRHETLRTEIRTVDGRPVQVILAQVDLKIFIEDLTYLPSDVREKSALELAYQEARRPFDLTRAPLMRAKLIKLAEHDHLALLTIHHIISDGWSTGVLIRELATLYPVLSAGNGADIAGLPELSIQYADYAAWQREWLKGEVLQDQINYWKEKLAGSPPILELPTDRARPAVQTMNGDQIRFDFGLDLTRKLEELSRQHGVTLFMTLLAAFQTLLFRYSGQTDISVGTPIANRTQADIEPLIGFFVNTLVMRNDLSGEPSFVELLERMRETALGAYAHQDVPFEMLVNEIQPERETSHSPLFQVMFVLQNVPAQTLQLPGLALTALDVTTGVAKFDLTLTMASGQAGLSGVLEFNTDLFDHSTIMRMIGHWKVLTQNLVSDSLSSIDVIPILPEDERQVLLGDWTATDQYVPEDTNLVRLFEEQVARTPAAVALIGRSIINPDIDVSITYAQLNQKANQLAHYLISIGVEPETLVGLQLERSVEMLIVLLAILKAGAAYLPLDPAYPKERLRFIMEDAQAKVLITQEKLTDTLGETVDDRVQSVVLDRDWAEIFSGVDSSNVERIIAPNNLAYVIYTSGSTGRPKGVMIEHHTAINLWAGLSKAIYANLIEIDPVYYHPIEGAQPLRVSLNAPLLFDASVQEWVMLLSGHCLVIVPQEARQDGEALLTFVRKHRIDVLDCVPSQLKLLIGAGLMDGDGFTPRAILPGGEAIDASTWQILSQSEKIQFFNMYGPTECTVDSTICWINAGKEHLQYPTRPSIGLPVINARLYVLDHKLQPTPIGIPGELFIAGGGVGRGYLNRPELTAERFLPNPFVSQDAPMVQKRLYRTGDLVRYLPDGTLEFLGRIDDQVKVRGFRIELGEIEATLLDHPGVREAAVLVREDRPGEKQLVAYLSEKQTDEPLTVGDLRNFLKSMLPDYMVPSVFIILPALPLTPNAKVDRKSLAARQIEAEQRARLENVYLAPRTPQEAILSEIWSQLLGHANVGIQDNFFELGGDSILSIQVTARANQAGLQISPRDLFENQTIEKLAAVARVGRVVEAEQGLVTGPVTLTPIQHWFFEQGFSDYSHWNQALFVEVLQPLDKTILAKVAEQLLNQHDALRLVFKLSEQGWQQENQGLPTLIPFEVIDLSSYSGDDRRQQIEVNARRVQESLDIEHGPLMRMAYFDLGPGTPGRLLIVIHHLAVDGVSWRILMEDFQTVYAQLAAASNFDAAVTLPPKSTSYQYWAAALEKYAQSNELEKELDYWLDVSDGEFLELPYDFDGGPNDEKSAEGITVNLTKDETTALLRDVPAAYQTEINDVLLAALARGYASWAQTMDLWSSENVRLTDEERTQLLVALEGHGREDLFDEVDISRTVGWFTTIYPIRLESSMQEGPGETLKDVKEMLRRVPRHGIGYGLLRYASRPVLVGGQSKASPLTQTSQPEISFNYLGQVNRSLAASALDNETERSGLFAPALESSGLPHSPRARRAYEIEIIGQVAGGQLSLDWLYSRNQFERRTIESFAGQFIEALRDIIQHCLAPEAGGYTPSDFSLAGLDQAKLDKMLQKLSQPKKKGSQ